jgi:MFS family permease
MATSPRGVDEHWNSLPLARVGSFWLLIAAQIVEQFADSLNLLLLLALMRGAFADDQLLANQALFIPTFVPIILLAPIAGVFVDRHSRRGWMLAAAGGRFALIGCMAFVAGPTLAGSRPALVGLIAAIVAISCLWQFYNPARSAALPEVVPASTLAMANTVSITALLIMQISGYLLGGFLGDNIDLAKGLAINAVFYLGTLLLLLGIRFHPVAHEFHPLSVKQVGRELWEALKILFSRDLRVRGSVVKVIGIAVFAGIGFTALQDFSKTLIYPPWIAALDAWTQMHWGMHLGVLTHFTLLLLTGGIGAGLGIVLLGWMRERVPQLLLIQCGLVFAAACFLVVAEAHTFAFAALGMGGTGLGAGLLLALTEARLQSLMPPHSRGKALSAYFLLRNGSVIVGVAVVPKALAPFTVLDPPFLLHLVGWGAVAFASVTAVVGLVGRYSHSPKR